MKLSSLNLALNFSQFQGICRFEVRKEYHTLKLYAALYQISFNTDNVEMNRQIMDTIKKKCNDDPFMSGILNSVNVQLRKEIIYTYEQLEDLDTYLSKFDSLSPDCEPQKLDLIEFKVLLTYRQIKRVRRFIYSLLWNFNIINDTIKHFTSQETISQNLDKKKEENLDNSPRQEEKLEITSEDNIICKILEFSLLPQVTSHLVHLILNYYRFYDDVTIITEGKKKIIEVPSIFTPNGIFNKKYMTGLFNVVKSLSIENVTLLTKNIINFILENEEELDSIHLKSISYILFINFIRYMYDTHPDYIFNNIEKVVTNPVVQTNIFNTFIEKILGSSPSVVFKIIPPKINEFEEKLINEEELESISNKYKHLKPISQEKFAELVFKNLKDKDKENKPNILLTSKVILDIRKFIKKDKTEEETLLVNEFLFPIEYTLLKYSLVENKITSEAYAQLLKYINDPSSILLLEKESKIPITVIKHFDSIKNILTDEFFKKDMISTFYYYTVLLENLKSFKYFDFSNILYIIYQIIIPYMYDIFGIYQFEDQFLNF